MGEIDGLMDAIKRMAEISGVDLSTIKIDDKIDLDKSAEFKEIEPYVLKMIGDEFKNIHRFEDFELAENKIKAVKNFMNGSDKKFLILRGTTGTAKSCIAKVLLSGFYKKLLKRESVKFFQQVKDFAYYTRAEDLFGKFKECFANGESTEWIIDNLNSYFLLIIDEIGATMKSEFELVKFTQLIDDFYRFSGRKMVLISNLENDVDWIKSIGNRAFSRICQYGTVIEFKGDDYRIQFKEVVA